MAETGFLQVVEDIVDRLAQHKSLGGAPREELEWLASHGSVRQVQADEVLSRKGSPLESLFVILSGHLATFVDRGNGPYKIMEWHAGDVAGLLPYSRLVSPPGDSIAQELTEVLDVRREHLVEMTRQCHEITAILVRMMIDRARASNSSDLRDAKLSAEKATRAKSEFLAKMSHEIRTPLNAVIGMADVLASSPLTPYQRKCVDVSQRNGIALLNLINDILDLTKVESGKIDIEAIGFDLREVVAGAVEVVEARASAKGLWLRQTIDPAVPVYRLGDPNRLRQVLVNLLGNSIKFTETGGLEIRIETDPDDNTPGRLRFAVRDTGIGIVPDKVDAVFESFTQADASTTRKYGGTGLGLTISKQLVELMGGRLWLESQLGVGSTFFFTVRADVQESQAERGEEKPQTPLDQLERQIAGMKILLADDSEDNRFLVASYLKGIECAIDTAENGEEAVALFTGNRYDLVLMDGEMPVMDGYTATREIRLFEKENARGETPILAFTAHAFAEMAARAFDAGFTDLLTKPIRKMALLEALAKYGKDRAPSGEEKVNETSRIRIAVDLDLRDVAPHYLEKRKRELSSMQQAAATGNLPFVQATAHKMKGTGAGYGFPFLTEVGEKMETAARQGNAVEVKSLISELAAWLDKVDLQV